MITCNEEDTGAFAISASSPAGTNPRDGASYIAVQAEIDKLTSIHAYAAIDWQKVAELSAKILREEGKDFNAAVWLLCAWTSTRGIAGLAMGVKVLRNMLECYWDNLTPPPARLRARRNQAEWMLEWLNAKLAETLQPVPGELINSLLEDWDGLDQFWSSQDSEGPSFFRLRRRLGELPIEAAAMPVVAAVAAPTPLTNPATSRQAAPTAAVEPQRSAAPPALAPMAPLGSLDSDQAIEKAVTDVFNTLSPLISFCLENHPTQPLLFRLNRQRAWMTLEQAPPAQGGQTRLPAPTQSLLESFARLQSAGEPLDILHFCEGNLGSYPFWLDLNQASHAALVRLGASAVAAAATLALETRQLLLRLPTLVELCFSDGQPFADGATRNWLEGLHPAATGGASDATQRLIDEAGHSAAEGRLAQALSTLQSAAEQAHGGRERFRLRRAQIELLHRFDPRAQLATATEVLLREAREQGLERWEPDLLIPLLELAMTQDDGGAKTLWAEQLAALDLPALWRLTSPPAS